MKPIAVLLMLTALTLTAHARHVGHPEARVHAASRPAADPLDPSRPAHKERSRRAARIDLTMPFYRFGRLPIRIKD